MCERLGYWRWLMQNARMHAQNACAFTQKAWEAGWIIVALLEVFVGFILMSGGFLSALAGFDFPLRKRVIYTLLAVPGLLIFSHALYWLEGIHGVDC